MSGIVRLGYAVIVFLLLLPVTSCGTYSLQTDSSGPGQRIPGIQNCQRTPAMPETLRMDNYRAPTPDCVPQGITLDTHDLKALMQQQPGLLLIDVLSVMSRPNTAFGESQWIPNRERHSLPGSVWLPNVGYGHLDDEMLHYFKSQLTSLTRGDKNRPLVFFCIADCWMSWNAVRRAADLGYTQVYWFKNGSDGWLEQGLKTQIIKPIPMMQQP